MKDIGFKCIKSSEDGRFTEGKYYAIVSQSVRVVDNFGKVTSFSPENTERYFNTKDTRKVEVGITGEN